MFPRSLRVGSRAGRHAAGALAGTGQIFFDHDYPLADEDCRGRGQLYDDEIHVCSSQLPGARSLRIGERRSMTQLTFFQPWLPRC
jgi:hypothetical protein